MAKMNPAQFMRQVKQEVSKVAWPSRKETVIASIMVLALSAVAAIYFLFVDQIVSYGIRLILGIGS